jgi:hypothetical protein
MKNANLPEWAQANDKGEILIDAQQFYPAMLDELWSDDHWPEKFGPRVAQNTAKFTTDERTVPDIQRGELDQYWLEVAFQCAKLDVQFAVAGTSLQAKAGGALWIIVVDSDKKKYRRANHPQGRGSDVAAQGLEARMHYQRIRNLPTL